MPLAGAKPRDGAFGAEYVSRGWGCWSGLAPGCSSTVRQPTREMGRIAAEQLLREIRQTGGGRMVSVDYALQLRDSTGRAPRRR